MDHPLRTFRLSRGMTLDALADVSGTTAATLSRIENRQVRPSLDLIERITAATGGAVTANDFVSAPPSVFAPPRVPMDAAS